MTEWETVLDYWFGSEQPPSKATTRRWFSGGAETDREIEQRFSQLHERLSQGYPEAWPQTGEALLAAIIVIDQFSRNLYRGQANAFSWDELAVQWSQQGWRSGLFERLSLAQQGFSLLPLVHSESLTLHEKAITELSRLQQQAGNDTIITGFLSSALTHRDIIQSFGRYPHRNKVLGRESTAAEKSYLADGAQRFGQ